MDQEQIRETAANIIQAMKNRDLAVMLAEAVLDGKNVLWNQSHIDHANRETGCSITKSTTASGIQMRTRCTA